MSEVLFWSGRLYKAMNNNFPKSRRRKHLSAELCFQVAKLPNNTVTLSYEAYESHYAGTSHSKSCTAIVFAVFYYYCYLLFFSSLNPSEYNVMLSFKSEPNLCYNIYW